MTIFRSLIAGAGLLVWSAAALAQSAAPTSSGTLAKTPEDVSHKTLKSEPTGPDVPFTVKPYLQIGHSPALGKLLLVWHATDAEATWTVEYRPGTGRRWQAAKEPVARRIAVAGVEPHRVYRVALTELEPGGTLAYRVHKGGKLVFRSRRPRAQGARPASALYRLWRPRGRHAGAKADCVPDVHAQA